MSLFLIMGCSGFCLRWSNCALIVEYSKILLVGLVPILLLFQFGVVLFMPFRFRESLKR